MHDLVGLQYPMFSIIESIRRLINIIQYENENFLHYANTFKKTRDVVKIKVKT